MCVARLLACIKQAVPKPKLPKELDIPSGSVATTLRRLKATGSTKSRPRGKRPPKLDKHAKRRILSDIDINPQQPWDDIGAKEGISGKTVARMANKEGLHKRKARPKPYLKPEQMEKRLKWASEALRRFWPGVIFTDEVLFEKGEKIGPTWTIRRAGEESMIKHLVPTFKQDRETLMVWGAVAIGHKWPLLRLTAYNTDFYDPVKTIDRFAYVNHVLEGRLAGYCSKLRREGIPEVRTLEDGAGPHRSRLAAQAREELHIKQIFHPPNSPDLNPIEPLWGIVKHRVARLRPVASTLDKLWEQVQRVWDELDQETIDRVLGKMEERRIAVVAAHGGHTRF